LAAWLAPPTTLSMALAVDDAVTALACAKGVAAGLAGVGPLASGLGCAGWLASGSGADAASAGVRAWVGVSGVGAGAVCARS
jgi:hypothetical protein